MASHGVSFDDLYRRSTQYQLWSYTREQLAQQRREVNEKGCRKVDERLTSTPEVSASSIEKVTMDEEIALISFHARSIAKLAKFFNMPSQVRVSCVSPLLHSLLKRSLTVICPTRPPVFPSLGSSTWLTVWWSTIRSSSSWLASSLLPSRRTSSSVSTPSQREFQRQLQNQSWGWSLRSYSL